VLWQAAVTLSLLILLLNSPHWTVYGPLLLANYPLLWWTIHVRRRLLVQTLPISRQLAAQLAASPTPYASAVPPASASDPP
jgi:hypothetical protein